MDHHYIFSVFGVLTVVVGEENERLSLDEWNRFAVLWEACVKIKFFKNFLKLKFLRRWRENCRFSRFLKLKNAIGKNILINIPEYSEPLVHISKLIQEIIDIRFLFKEETNKQDVEPIELAISRLSGPPATTPSTERVLKVIESAKSKKNSTELTPAKEKFTLAKFLTIANELTLNSSISLDYFFVYVKFILMHTREKLFNRLRLYQKLVNQSEPL